MWDLVVSTHSRLRNKQGIIISLNLTQQGVAQLVEHLRCHFEVPSQSPAKLLLDYLIHGCGWWGRVSLVYQPRVGLKGPALRGFRVIKKKKKSMGPSSVAMSISHMVLLGMESFVTTQKHRSHICAISQKEQSQMEFFVIVYIAQIDLEHA